MAAFIANAPAAPTMPTPPADGGGLYDVGGEMPGSGEGGGVGETDVAFATGGIVTQPTMAMVGEAGAEAIIPLNEGIIGGIVINITEPVFLDNEASMNQFVDKIRKGIQRQDRLRFGGAYHG